ncbi:hypothetical protein YB2330_006013 [Saitoella coloradoensis]
MSTNHLPPPPPQHIPSSLLIIGSGVFGLTTALTLSTRHPQTPITIVDRHSLFPSSLSPDAASIDTSRILRADYADEVYASLAGEAIAKWAQGFGDVWWRCGMALVHNVDDHIHEYVEKSRENVTRLCGPDAVRSIDSVEDWKEIPGAGSQGGGVPVAGEWKGYLNRGSGWADAEEAMMVVLEQCRARPNLTMRSFVVKELIYDDTHKRVLGVRNEEEQEVCAELTILATGAWTGGLLDLSGRALSTGQTMAYLSLTPEEEARLRDMPVVLNLSTGWFTFPPRNGLLKIATHTLGYLNTQEITLGGKGKVEVVEVSVPRTSVTNPGEDVPQEAEEALRAGLRKLLPELADRPFSKTRICWYTDTPTSDFIIGHHPDIAGLFMATGGSGHAFKFLPVLGEKVADAIEGRLEKVLQNKWRWREGVVDIREAKGDGSRGRSVRKELAALLQSSL